MIHASPSSENAIAAFTNKLGYVFRQQDYIQQALCHRSYANEQPDASLPDNERFEFLGDAVLSLVIGHMLMDRFPEIDEGDLSRMRAALVNEHRLAALARDLDLGSAILLGKGEELTQGRQKSSILADTMEAVIAAVYLDGGFDCVFNIIETLLGPFLDDMADGHGVGDHKSRLQELAQTMFKQVPSYQVVKETGPDHEKTFHVCLTVSHFEACGKGHSKKRAEQDAARRALNLIRE